jgi:hypothetical protein
VPFLFWCTYFHFKNLLTWGAKLNSIYIFRNSILQNPKRPLGRPRHRWEDNIKMDLKEVGCGGMDWIELAYNRDRWQALGSVVMNLQVP